MRVTNSPASRKRRMRTLKAAKGFRLKRSKLYRYAADALDHGRQYAFRDRKTKKRNYRTLWQARTNGRPAKDARFLLKRAWPLRAGPQPKNSCSIARFSPKLIFDLWHFWKRSNHSNKARWLS